MSNLVIYDDSVTAFTEPKYLQHAYGKFWDNGLPISIGIAPLVRGTSGIVSIPANKRESTTTYRLSDNKILCNYLGVMAEQRLVEICQYGFHGTADEFAIDDDILLQQKIEEGQAELKHAFPENEIKTVCTPPSKLSDTAIQLLTEYDFNICAYSNDDNEQHRRVALNDARALFHYSHYQEFSAQSPAQPDKLMQSIMSQSLTILRVSYVHLLDSATAMSTHDKWQSLCDAILSQQSLTIDTFTYI